MRLKYYTKTIILIALIAFSNGCATSIKPTPDFRSSVREHLAAVENKDLETFIATLTKTNDLQMILPGGGVLENTQVAVDFHEGMFKDEKWIFKTEIVKLIEGTTQSTAVVKYDYQDSVETEPRQAWLVLTFQLEDNSWLLIHDQNTRIDAEDEK